MDMGTITVGEYGRIIAAIRIIITITAIIITGTITTITTDIITTIIIRTTRITRSALRTAINLATRIAFIGLIPAEEGRTWRKIARLVP